MLSGLAAFFARPGVQSSEFKVLAAVTAWLGVNSSTHTVTFLQGLVIALPGVVYAVARGLAKTETRTQPPPTPGP